MYLDHLAVAGQSLAEAVDAIETALGVAMQMGGRHAVYGTHNRLLGLADGLYLEAIAVDPAAVPERRPRWFDLDRFSGPARLSNWICRCDDMAAIQAELNVDAGTAVALSRGDLRWHMAVPPDGILPFDNMFPALITWQSDHPAARLAHTGCRLRRLVISHPEAATLSALLAPWPGLAGVVFETGAAGILAEFDTPHGVRVLQ